MPDNHLPLFRVQFGRFVQNRLRHAKLADIVQQRCVLQTDGVQLFPDVFGQVTVEQHGELLHMAAVAVQIGIPGVDDTDQNLGDIDAALLRRLHQLEHQGLDNGDKDAAEKENGGHHQIRT